MQVRLLRKGDWLQKAIDISGPIKLHNTIKTFGTNIMGKEAVEV